ncbi:MAG: glycosyltransferase family 2 protein, partial [Prolixibacteraceae bacterium]|nr:glycosyltransferase family 2 protein [Prolixibacteraceae bacterium]
MKRSISIVIPNYNGKDLLESNIPHVYNALKTSGITDFEIIITDDASKDQSVDFLKSNYPDIILIENKVNRGFSGNTNCGIFRANKDLVLILNSDVILTDCYFEHLLPYFDSPGTFGVMGQITSPDSKIIQDGAKYPTSAFGRIRPGTNYLIKGQSSHLSLFLLGANALVDRKKLLEVGGFDEIFNPYNSEDVDLSIRAWRLGYKCYYDHRAICKHPISSTLKKEPNRKVKMISNRNVMIL